MSRRVVVKKYDKNKVSREELSEIRKQNREKLDWVLEQGPEYMIEKAKEVYGENWMAVFAGEKHYLHYERYINNRRTLNDGSRPPKKGNRQKQIQKIDYQTNELICVYDNAEAARVGENLSDKQISTLLSVCTGKYEHYKGYKWVFVEEPKQQTEIIENETRNED
jgi:hypothetical protein